MEVGNIFIAEFLVRFYENFAVRAERPEDLHRPVPLNADWLRDILCHREQRHVGQQLTLAYDRKQSILDRSVVSGELGGQYVDLYDFSMPMAVPHETGLGLEVHPISAIQ